MKIKEMIKMKRKKQLLLLSSIVVLVIIVGSFYIFTNDENGEFPDLPTTQTVELTSDNLTLKLNFKGSILRANGKKESWNDENMKPFIESLKVWSNVIKGAKGVKHHTLVIDVHVNHFNGGNGAAMPEYSSLVKVGEHYLPTQGYIVINNRLYDMPEVFQQPENKPDVMCEFNANIYHELGHVFGIGSLWETYDDDGELVGSMITKEKTTGKGNVCYDMPKTIAAYNQIFSTNLEFIPISDDGGHYYDYEKSDDQQRIEGIWKNTEGLAYDLMANGHTITKITAAGLDDLGWEIDYNHVKPYDIK